MDRITTTDALDLLQNEDLLALGREADAMCVRHNGRRVRTFAVDRNINTTNVCTSLCGFCAFCRRPTEPGAYVLADTTVDAKVAEAARRGATHVLLQGGLHLALGLPYAEALLRRLRKRFGIGLHCFSPPEIVHFARLEEIPFSEVLARLRDAGLDSLPGGGAEILVDRVRRLVSPGKCSADEWFDVMRAAHGLGLRTTATMMFGHAESLAERVEHLDRLRRLQDETGGFTAFICWPFQAAGTRLGRALSDGTLRADWAPEGRWRPSSAVDYLRTLAIARRLLDNFGHVQSSWVTMGPKVGQMALQFGADDLGSTMMEENVVRAAGTTHRQGRDDLVRLIADAGFVPHQRDCLYKRTWPAAECVRGL